MDISKPLFWHQGLFLQPQHFQMQDLHVQSLLAPIHRFLQPHFWGVGSMEIREAALTSMTFDLFGGEFVFPDGTYVTYPGNALFQARSFAAEWATDEEALTVFLGLRKWNPAGGNVTVVPALESPGEVSTRFVSTADSEAVKDLYESGPEAQMKRLHYVLRVFWSTEESDLNEYDLIPLAQLERDGKEIVLSSKHIPPCLSLAGSARLEKLVKQIRDQVGARTRLLEDAKSSRDLKTADLEMGDFVQILGLRTLSRYVPLLLHLTGAPDVHPWRVYALLRQLIGELSTFSDRLGADGLMQDDTRVVPLYDHRHLEVCFSTAQAVINFLLDEIALGGENIIRLEREDGFFVGDMPESAFDPRFGYCLILRTEEAPESVIDGLLTVGKLSSRRSIDDLTTRFISGVPLEHLPYPPPGVPRLAHALYFRIDKNDGLWQEVQQTGAVALYWDTAPEDLIVEIAVQRKA